ncbi:S-layer homology domain-containing protein [Syntrophomonas erecta]
MGLKRIVPGLVVAIMLVCSMIPPAYGEPNGPVANSIQQAVTYLKGVQNPDGGFPWQDGDETSDPVATAWVVMALKAAGEDSQGNTWIKEGKHPVDYLCQKTHLLETTCDYARTGIALAGKDSPAHLLQKIESFQQPNGHFGQTALGEDGFINSHMWSILALHTNGVKISHPEKALQWLLSRQNEDGGFGWYENLDSDADDTAVAVQVMAILGEKPGQSTSLQKALNYLKTCQQADGGFNSGWADRQSNTSTSAWVLQALTAAGEDPYSQKWSVKGNNVVDYLFSCQDKSGSFRWIAGEKSAPLQSTAFALSALSSLSEVSSRWPGRKAEVNPDPLVDSTRKLATDSQVEDRTSPFYDLSPNHWAYQAIEGLAVNGIVNGYPDKTFRPGQLVSRAEFTCMLIGSLGIDESEKTNGVAFPDVNHRHWAASYIGKAHQEGYIKGRPEGLFDPDGLISGAELASILVRVIDPVTQDNHNNLPYWYSGYVQTADRWGLLYPDFDPNRSATRAECAYSLAAIRTIYQDQVQQQ